MTKSDYDKLFAKAEQFYITNNCEIKVTTPNYKQFKAACDALINSEHNSIDPESSYKYNALNKLFNQPSVDELLNSDW